MKQKIISLCIIALLAFPISAGAVSDPAFIGPPIRVGKITVKSLAKTLTGTQGKFFSAHFAASGGVAPYAWTVSGLPAGLSWSLQPTGSTNCIEPLDSLQANTPARISGCPAPYVSGEDMVVSGTPTQVGSSTATFTVTDSLQVQTTQTFVFTVQAGDGSIDALAITPEDGYGVATVGKSYRAVFTATGGVRPYAWTLTGDLPTGVTRSFPQFNCITTPCIAPIDLYDSLFLSGTPTKAGTYTFTISVRDASGTTRVQSYSIVVADTAAGIQVTSPSAGSTWVLGGSYAITWDNTAGIARSVNVNIELMAPRPACLDSEPRCAIRDIAPYAIATNISDSGSYTWDIPKDLPAAYQGARHIVVSTVNGTLRGQSAQFTISAKDSYTGPIQISAPAEGAQWIAGKQYTITWSGTDSLPVQISLQPTYNCVSGSYCPAVMPKATVIANGVVGSSFQWTVPSSLNGTYRITMQTVAPAVDFVLWGESGLFRISQSGATPKKLASAQVVRTPDKAVHLILDGGQYYTFATWEEFLRRGYVFQHIVPIAQNDLSEYTATSTFSRPSGTTFKYTGDRTVYYLTSALCKQAYASFGTFQAWKLRLVDIVTFAATEQYPTCSTGIVQLPSGVAVKGGTRTVYILENGLLRPVATMAALRSRGLVDIYAVGDTELDSYSKGEIVQ